MSILNEFLWTEIYRPTKVADCILPPRVKNLFQGIVDAGTIPNMLFYGTPGSGKTSVAMAMATELGMSYYYNNAAKERGIDVTRVEIAPFASTIALNGKRKVVIVDEADGATADYQNAMKVMIEEFSKNCTFIFIANHTSKIIEAIHSRTMAVEFRILPDEREQMTLDVFRRTRQILKTENISYDADALSALIKKYFPDVRRILTEMQKFALHDGLKNEVIKDLLDGANYGALYAALKAKNLKGVREWIVAYVDFTNVHKVIRDLYDNMKIYLKPDSIPSAIMVLSECQYRAAFVTDQEINLMAHLTDMMAQCEFL